MFRLLLLFRLWYVSSSSAAAGVVPISLGGASSAATARTASDNPVLVMFDRWSKSHTAIYLPAKGIGHPYSAEAVARAVSRHGYRRVVLKSDQEPALVALLAAAKDLCTCEVLLEHSPKGEPQANGEAERAVQSIMGLARTLK